MKHLFLLLTLLSFSLTALAQQKVTGKVKDSSGGACHRSQCCCKRQ